MKKNKKKSQPPAPTAPAMLLPLIPLSIIAAVVAGWGWMVLSRYVKQSLYGLGVLENYFSLVPFANSPLNWMAVAGHAGSLGAALLVMMAVYAAGKLPIRFFEGMDLTALERFLLTLTLGCGLLCALLFAVGIAGFLYAGIVSGIVVLTAGTAIWFLVRDAKDWRPFSVTGGLALGFEKLWFGVAAVLALVAVIGCCAPETFFDSLVYHLAKPHAWLQNHRITPDVTKVISGFFPGNINLLYAACLAVKDSSAAKFLHLFFGVATVLMVYAAARRWSSHRAGILAAGIFLFVPYTGMLLYRTSVELPLALFETMAVFCFLRMTETNDRRWLLLAGLQCGMAIGTKYLSFFCLVSLEAALLLHAVLSRQNLRRTLTDAVLLAGISLAVAAPWFIYNMVHTGNPLYPYFVKYLGHVKPKSLIDSATYGISMFGMPALKRILIGPWTITMGMHEEAFAGPHIALFFPLFLAFRNRWKGAGYLALYLALYWALWGISSTMYFRYFMPAMPMVAVLCGIYFTEARFPAWMKTVFYGVMTWIAVQNVLFVMNLQKVSTDSLGVAAGKQSAYEYMTTSRMTYPNPYYGMADWINKHTPADAVILYIGEERTMYVNRRGAFCDIANDSLPVVWSRTASDARGVYDQARAAGITHILFNVPEAARMSGYDMLNFTAAELEVFSSFWESCVQEIHRDLADMALPAKQIYSLKKQQPEYWAQYAANPRNYVYLYAIVPPEKLVPPRQPPFNFFREQSLYTADRWKSISADTRQVP